MVKLNSIIENPISGEWGLEDLNKTGLPVLRTTNFTNEGIINYNNIVTRIFLKENIKEKFLKYGDILLEKSGGSDNQPVGRVVFFDKEDNKYLFNNFVTILRIKNKEKYIPKYIFYSLYYNYKNGGTIKFQNKTTGIHNLQVKSFINNFQVKTISTNKQYEIIKILDTIYNLIILKKLQLSKLDQLVKSRFIEMFGDPIRNEKNWPVVSLGEVAEICIGPFGTLLHKEDYIYGGHAIINPSHILEGKIYPDKSFTISEKKYIELNSYHLQKGDIVLGRRGEMGRCAVVESSGLICGTGSMIIRPYKKMKPYFIQNILSSPGYKKAIEDKAVGVTMLNLNVRIVSEIKIPLLPITMQENFITLMHKVDEAKLSVKQSLEALETLKKSLMQEYFG